MKNVLKNLDWGQVGKTALAALLCVLVVGGAVFLGSRVSKARAEITQIKVDIANLERNQDEYLALKSALQGSAGRGSELSKLIPLRNDILNNIQLLEQVSSSTGNSQEIQIVEVAPGTKGVKATKKTSIEPTLSTKFAKVDYVISLNGSFVDLMEYIKSLEHQPFLTTVKSIAASAQTSSAGSNATLNTGGVTTKIEGMFFYVK